MDETAREEIETLAAAYVRDRQLEPGACGVTPPGYKVQVYCNRPAGHDGRHWCNAISWPA